MGLPPRSLRGSGSRPPPVEMWSRSSAFRIYGKFLYTFFIDVFRGNPCHVSLKEKAGFFDPSRNRDISSEEPSNRRNTSSQDNAGRGMSRPPHGPCAPRITTSRMEVSISMYTCVWIQKWVRGWSSHEQSRFPRKPYGNRRSYWVIAEVRLCGVMLS